METAYALTATQIWLWIYGICAVLFFSIAVWVIVRGGRDVLEILTEARDNHATRKGS